MRNPDEWFCNVVAEGLAQLFVLRLKDCPAADILEGVEHVWVNALWLNRSWVYERDYDRLRRAFIRLASTQQRWPAPAQLIECLPSLTSVNALPARPASRSPEEIKKARRILNDIMQGIQAQKSTNTGAAHE